MVFPSLAPWPAKATLWSLTFPSSLFHPCVAREENWKHKGQRFRVGIRTIYGKISKIRKQAITAIILMTNLDKRGSVELELTAATPPKMVPPARTSIIPLLHLPRSLQWEGTSFSSLKWEKEPLSSTPGSGIRWYWITQCLSHVPSQWSRLEPGHCSSC